MATEKYRAIWRIIRASSFHATTQRESGAKPQASAEGYGDIQDMVLMAIELKEAYNGFVDVITHAATEGGELHFLEELKKSLGALEKE